MLDTDIVGWFSIPCASRVTVGFLSVESRWPSWRQTWRLVAGKVNVDEMPKCGSISAPKFA